MPHLLELFCGTKSVGKVFEARGWKVTSVDFDPQFEPTLCMNVLDLEPSMIEGNVDLVWASPLCTHYLRARTTARTPRPTRSCGNASISRMGSFATTSSKTQKAVF